MQYNKKNTYYILGFGLLLFLALSAYLKDQKSEAVSEIKVLIAQQETTIISLAEVTDRNGGDAVVSEIIKDCIPEDRQKFDELLGSLANLKYTEIVEVDQLFDACGDFFAERKSLMVARLAREFEVYNDYVTLLRIIDDSAAYVQYPLDDWSELVSLEKQRSQLTSELVKIQKAIIAALLEGVPVSSQQMLDEITKAREAQETLSFTGVKIDALREGIMKL